MHEWSRSVPPPRVQSQRTCSMQSACSTMSHPWCRAWLFLMSSGKTHWFRKWITTRLLWIKKWSTAMCFYNCAKATRLCNPVRIPKRSPESDLQCFLCKVNWTCTTSCIHQSPVSHSYLPFCKLKVKSNVQIFASLATGSCMWHSSDQWQVSPEDFPSK